MRKSTMLYGYDYKTRKAQRFGIEMFQGHTQWYDGDEFVELSDDEKIIAQLVNHSRNRNDIINALKFIDSKHKNHNTIDYTVEIVDII